MTNPSASRPVGLARCLFLVLCLHGSSLPAAPAPKANLPLITTVQALRSLTVEEAGRGHPVRLRGVVTFYDAEWRILFVQDGADALFVNPGSTSLLIK
ncbi:MAG: hypothetical protein AAB676_11815 [Verrucomicrobiota bacterium]